jgi:hypothetical protein
LFQEAGKERVTVNCRGLRFGDFDGGWVRQKAYEFYYRNELPALNFGLTTTDNDPGLLYLKDPLFLLF